jgi:hypothetical protein
MYVKSGHHKNKKQNKKQQQLNIHRLHPVLNYFQSVAEWHRFLLDKGVAILWMGCC